jgi:saccharopine dehydrogenase-like NADP-dependent oxidoreductase
MLVGSAYNELGGLDSAQIWVGGVPQSPPDVFKHAVYFNPHDLLAEYIRPARARLKGMDMQPLPMDVEFRTFSDSELGIMQAFLSDGLRSLLGSFPNVANMEELTLRWDGHLTVMQNMHKLGLFESPPAVQAFGDVIGRRYPAKSFPDVLLMVVDCRKGSERRAWRLIDRCQSGQSAMSRTTGYTTAATAMVLARKQFSKPGVHAPEQLGLDRQVTSAILSDLSERGVVVEPLKEMSGALSV